MSSVKPKKIVCAKCKAKDQLVEARTEAGYQYVFCKICAIALNSIPVRPLVIQNFLASDFGDLLLSEEQKNIINARKSRNEGTSLWKKPSSEEILE